MHCCMKVFLKGEFYKQKLIIFARLHKDNEFYLEGVDGILGACDF